MSVEPWRGLTLLRAPHSKRTLVMAAAVTGHLPEFMMAIRRAQVQLIQESKASNWGSPDLLYRNIGNIEIEHERQKSKFSKWRN